MVANRSSDDRTESVVRISMAGFLSWLVPGLGHIYLGDKKRGIIFLVTIATTFWGGVAIGGVRGTVNPQQRKAWFMAEVCAGGHALAAYGLHKAQPEGLTKRDPQTGEWPYVGHWLAVEIGIVYAAVAGLLNVLIILDALVRADSPHPQPVREVAAVESRSGKR